MPKLDLPHLKFEIDQNPHFFLEKFEKLAEINKWNGEQKCLQFCLTLPKEAETWYLTLTEERKENFLQLCQLTYYDGIHASQSFILILS